MNKLKPGDRVKFNTKDPLYTREVKKDFKDSGLDCRKIYEVESISINNSKFITIKDLSSRYPDNTWHHAWWIKVEPKKKQKKYEDFTEMLGGL